MSEVTQVISNVSQVALDGAGCPCLPPGLPEGVETVHTMEERPSISRLGLTSERDLIGRAA